jgi:adenine-specific DNA-methyltransferase
MPRRKNATSTPVTSHKHKDKRANIPTEELRAFVADDERKPKTMLYPRDPSLDPQLVWKGKDEQDQQPLAVPIYIQEKIHPHAIIEQVRAQAQKHGEPQTELFSDFNGIKFEDLIDFYRHKDGVNWSNRMILGDSLLVMTSLAEKEGLKGKVQMIYIDPPYGIKFGSNWQVSTRKRDVKDGKAEDLTRQPEQIRAFRDTWKLGIHSYLAYLRDRLVVARELLTESGSIFVQIGDENVHLVRCLLDEVFGSENFCALIPFVTTSSQTSELIATVCDFLLWYSKSRTSVKYRQLYSDKQIGETGGTKYKSAELPTGQRLSLNQILDSQNDMPSGAKIFRPSPLVSQSGGENSRFPVEFCGNAFTPRTGFWKTNRQGFDRLIAANRIIIEGNSLAYIRYLQDFPVFPHSSLWDDTWGVQSRSDPKRYVVQTDTKVIERCLLMTTDPGDLVLDPTCGSGTTAYVAEQWGRRWITIDTSRVALALARTRLMAAKFPYYILADSAEGIMKEAEITGQIPPTPLPKIENDIKKGFVYKRVPHITLKSIANNEEIDVIHAKWQEKLEPIRAKLNKLLKQSWEEWQIPREISDQLSVTSDQLSVASELIAEWWRLRRERQKEIDESIARHADTELLYDQPYEDNKRIRVSGPFTVESLSPHRVLAADAERPLSEIEAQKEPTNGQFETMIIENLKKAGVQNTRKNERLKFDRLETYAGTWLHAAGEYAESDGASSGAAGAKTKRVAISIGPEHGTVGPEQVREAAKEAVRGAGFDLLVVCGFAFDAHASETAQEFTPELPKRSERMAVAETIKQYGKLPVMLARMNPDLAMGDELLKKTGAGNLFMVFGEPDIDIKKQKDGKLVVAIKGVDVYDPTTGQIRSSSTDDIACWFIDTNYNEESFFVRHAYFTGADEPYEKLKRALRAEIDEAAWSTLYSSKSRPFDPPQTGKIAVKVINHYGDEVLKVYSV